jgi:hypothetical protein
MSSPADSVLKSLLLDSSSRKRPISPPPPPPVAVVKNPFPADETDILRRRLLGLPDLEPVPAKPAPKFSPPSATVTSRDADRQTSPLAVNLSQNFIESLRNNLNPSDDARFGVADVKAPRLIDERTSYKTTSVLKHLLHRYNADATDNSKKEI